MAYVMIEGYMCERCLYRWASHTGTGTRSKNDPKVCPKCKSTGWNQPRRNNRSPEHRAAIWNRKPDTAAA